MKITRLIAMAALVSVFASCQKEPQASFQISDSRVAAGESIRFYNNTDYGHSYEWDFGDGTTSTEEEPVKVYNSPGVYDIRLKAYSKNRKKVDDSRKTLTVNEPPFAGSHRMESSWQSAECNNGTVVSRSGTSVYTLTIKAGSTDNEIIIDNLANLGINGVRCRVTEFSLFFMEEYSFQIIAGQTLTDSKGNTWNFSTTDVTGSYDNLNNCRQITAHLKRSGTCGATNASFFVTDNASENGCN